MAGKMSTIIVFLLMINIIGYIIFIDMVSAGIATGNPYVTENSLLTRFYSNVTDPDGTTTYVIDENSALFDAVPLEPPESFLADVGQFIDRIFIMFDFMKTIMGVLLFPIALISFMGLPASLSMLLFIPLTMLYVMGIIDLITGGNS